MAAAFDDPYKYKTRIHVSSAEACFGDGLRLSDQMFLAELWRLGATMAKAHVLACLNAQPKVVSGKCGWELICGHVCADWLP